jgi:hypothetical protein
MSKAPFLGKYEILGGSYRREGGQGIVQVRRHKSALEICH